VVDITARKVAEPTAHRPECRPLSRCPGSPQ
jgi:hypothetical protein